MGDDKVALRTREYLDAEGVNHDHISGSENSVSNTYYVLRRGAERTILVKNEAYEYNWQAPESRPDWIYLSLIGDDSWQLHEDMLAYLDQHPEVKFAFQPGTFHFKWGTEKCAPLYKRSTIVIMNREEAVEVTGGDYENVRQLIERIHELGSEIVVITDGPKGSYAGYGGKFVTIPNYPDSAPPLDRTGAGDAFASTIVAALALGEDIETALTWAPINSMNVVQQLGAQAGLQTREQIQTWLKKAPRAYKVTELNDN
jgi:ribokinase